MNNKFILINKEQQLLIYLEKYILTNIPKNEITIKIKLNDEIYKLIENTIRFNINIGNIKNKYINETKVNIMLIDFYLNIIYSKELCIKKRYLNSIKILTEIKNIIYSISNNENKKEFI